MQPGRERRRVTAALMLGIILAAVEAIKILIVTMQGGQHCIKKLNRRGCFWKAVWLIAIDDIQRKPKRPVAASSTFATTALNL